MILSSKIISSGRKKHPHYRIRSSTTRLVIFIIMMMTTTTMMRMIDRYSSLVLLRSTNHVSSLTWYQSSVSPSRRRMSSITSRRELSSSTALFNNHFLNGIQQQQQHHHHHHHHHNDHPLWRRRRSSSSSRNFFFLLSAGTSSSSLSSTKLLATISTSSSSSSGPSSVQLPQSSVDRTEEEEEEDDSSDDDAFDDDDPFNDTIFALSSGHTGDQATAVAVIRISGPDAHSILQQLLVGPSSSPSSSSSSKETLPTPPKLPIPRQAVLKKLYFEGQILDHALILLFNGPQSYTGQDIVEIQCHGSRPVVRKLLTDVLPSFHKCRLAEPGEFTQRAYQNGKLDLIQVEALADVLTADTSRQVTQALAQLDGRVSRVYEDWRTQLISGLAHAEAVIDFGDDEHLGLDDDYDDSSIDHNDTDFYLVDTNREELLQRQQANVWGDVSKRMTSLRRSMENHLGDNRRGELIREGIKIVIIGPPNAGKSSLFNVLAQRDVAIVSPIAGTTRDVLQVSLDLCGIKCTIHDTAGVRTDTDDVLELEGMKRAKAVVDSADLVVAMVDSTEIDRGLDMVRSVLQQQEEGTNDSGSSDTTTSSSSSTTTTTTMGGLDPKRLLLVLNKSDLRVTGNDDENDDADGSNFTFHDDDEKDWGGLQFGGGTYGISCLTQEGITTFLDALTQQVRSRTEGSYESPGDDNGGEGALITRVRHRQHIQAAVEALYRFDGLSSMGNMAVDMAAEELRLAASELGRVTGAVDVEDVLDVLFTDFCIGK